MYDAICLFAIQSALRWRGFCRLWRFVHQFVTINPPVSSTNGLLLPEVIKPEDIMFE